MEAALRKERCLELKSGKICGAVEKRRIKKHEPFSSSSLSRLEKFIRIFTKLNGRPVWNTDTNVAAKEKKRKTTQGLG